MSKKVPVVVPLPGGTDHPVVINIVFNDTMQRWDVELLTGNFKSEEAAREMAEYLREVMEAGWVDRKSGSISNELGVPPLRVAPLFQESLSRF